MNEGRLHPSVPGDSARGAVEVGPQAPVVMGAIGDDEAPLGERLRDAEVVRGGAPGRDAPERGERGAVHAHVAIGEDVVEHVLVLANVGDSPVWVDALTLSGWMPVAEDLLTGASVPLIDGIEVPAHGFWWLRVTERG